MTKTANIPVGASSISAMDLRRQPGAVLDRVYYNRESIIIKRANEPKAVLVPLLEYQQLQRIRKDSRKRLFEQIDKMRKNAASMSPRKIEKVINEAIKATRLNASTS